MVDYSKWDKIDTDDEDEESIGANTIATKKILKDQSPDIELQDQQLLASGATYAGKIAERGEEGRVRFKHEGKTIYEWEQSLEEVNIYIVTPPGVTASMIDCKITYSHLQLGIKGNPPFIDEDTGGPILVDESYWMLTKKMVDQSILDEDDGKKNEQQQQQEQQEQQTSSTSGVQIEIAELNINLQKMRKGETWDCALRGAKGLAPNKGAGGGPGAAPTAAEDSESGGGEGSVISSATAVDPITKQEMQRRMMLERFQEENPGFDFSQAEFNGQVPDPRTFMGGVKYN